ncbi:MAG TPA: AgmX/PglI C-terminal domain-containing protein, partial [Polyangia bacterium]|nr:AgmX/PglI C-terminal domain-containing protein [Polyangia bacterium]
KRGGAGSGGKQGTIDAAETNKFINAHFSQVRSCYERRLKNNPLLEGNLDLKIRLTPKGRVGSIAVNSDTVRDGEMLDCVMRTIRGWQFPAPVDGWVLFDKSFKFQKKN